MNTEIISIGADELETAEAREAVERAGAVIKNGGLVAFPTETVYGLGGDAFDAGASEKIYSAKGRPSDNPLIVHIAEPEDIERVAVNIPDTARVLAERFWPGPMTIVLDKAPSLPFKTTGGLDTVAVRLPSHPVARALIRAGGGFIAAPSANRSGRPSPTTAWDCIEDLGGRVDVIIDGGPVGLGVESSIIDLTVDPPALLRPGYITPSLFRDAIGDVETAVSAEPESGPKAPGMKYRHYAPRGRMTVVRGDEDRTAAFINERVRAACENGLKTAVIASRETAGRYEKGARVYIAGGKSEAAEVAQNIFSILRQLDRDGAEEIFCEEFGGDEVSLAVMNRLFKACGGNITEV